MKLQNYSLRYGARVLVEDACVDFRAGHINHLLGENGSGKSTLAKSLAGLVPHSGTLDLEADSITIIGSYSGLPLNLKVSEILRLSEERAGKRLYRHLYEHLGLSTIPRANRIRALSDGQRQKLKLLFFLSAKPQVIVLDECTSALDRKSVEGIRSFLNSYLNQKGVTSINITHDVSDLTTMPGENYLLENETITHVSSVEQIVRRYIGGASHAA